MQVKGFGVKKIQKNITFGEITVTIFVGLKKKNQRILFIHGDLKEVNMDLLLGLGKKL